GFFHQLRHRFDAAPLVRGLTGHVHVAGASLFERETNEFATPGDARPVIELVDGVGHLRSVARHRVTVNRSTGVRSRGVRRFVVKREVHMRMRWVAIASVGLWGCGAAAVNPVSAPHGAASESVSGGANMSAAPMAAPPVDAQVPMAPRSQAPSAIAGAGPAPVEAGKPAVRA